MGSVLAIDAMGSDGAPGPDVAGAVAAVREAPIEVILVGDAARVHAELVRLGASGESRLHVEHAASAVTMDDHPAQVFRTKRDSSLRVAVELVKSGRAHALVSAGNSGAILSHALYVLGRADGVERPALVTVFPTPAGPITLCDVGANVDVKPSMLAQFGVLGASYDRVVHGRARPRVGLLSNGTEPSKGTELTRAAFPLLEEAAARHDFAFVGYVEGSGLWDGAVDVVATDGFTGNVVLKTCEGLSASLRGVDYAATGGALLAGVAGVVVIAHGRSDATAIKNAALLADRFATASCRR